jgi:hypothetical protein
MTLQEIVNRAETIKENMGLDTVIKHGEPVVGE